MTNSVIRSKGSLCSGTGALDRATPGELRWVAETAEAPTALLKREHPEVLNLGDITTLERPIPYVNLLTSGDPCQSMSAAGKRLATGDERFLWPHVMDVIRAMAPREIFLENVQNIVSVALVKGGERGGVLQLRLDDLREAGYEVRWTVLGACAVGAPHHRHRWFLRARYVGTDAPEAVRLINQCGAPRSGGRTLLPTPNARDGGSRGTPTREHALRRVGNPERSVNLEDAVVAYLLPTPSASSYGYNQGGAKETGAVRYSLESMGRMDVDWAQYGPAIELWEQILGRPAPEPTEAAPKGGRRLNAALSEWMMGYPEGYLTKGVSRNEALKMAGNGVVELQARARHGTCLPGDHRSPAHVPGARCGP